MKYKKKYQNRIKCMTMTMRGDTTQTTSITPLLYIFTFSYITLHNFQHGNACLIGFSPIHNIFELIASDTISLLSINCFVPSTEWTSRITWLTVVNLCIIKKMDQNCRRNKKTFIAKRQKYIMSIYKHCNNA